ncbi:hypothetical protein [uncultured Deefgea sp.]|uniref:hypothetical protein n=1 Tax=uncultured Deefgea sp. TaxID=1304914 RepID=UPI002608036D|nr:hypothetical protein [uncultured Deefgea sp.]
MNKIKLIFILLFAVTGCSTIPSANISKVKLKKSGQYQATITFEADTNLFDSGSNTNKFSVGRIYCPIAEQAEITMEKNYPIYIDGYIKSPIPKSQPWIYTGLVVLDKSNEEKDKIRIAGMSKYDAKKYYSDAIVKGEEWKCKVIMIKAFGSASYSNVFVIPNNEILKAFSLIK